jgi:hypothetical protein
MGLDQYAYFTNKENLNKDNTFKEEPEEDFYWRKNHYLQGYMENLYTQKTKQPKETFNCKNLKLTKQDLINLKKAIENKELIQTKGIFYGNDFDYYDCQSKYDLKFIKEALNAIKEKKVIVYQCWY